MTNLNKAFQSIESIKYDWNTIEDPNNRAAAKSTVQAYEATFNKIYKEVTHLAGQNNLALARCVYTLKLTLPHGEFSDVCTQALKLDEKKRAALVKVGRETQNSDLPIDEFLMLDQMEPRAAAKFLEQPAEVKMDHVVDFKEKGIVPTRNTFIPKKRVATVKTTKEELTSTITFLTSWLDGVEKISPEGKELLIKLSESIERVL